MPRGFRLRDLQTLVDVADADLAREQQTEDAEPGGISQGLEEGFHFGQLLGHIYVLTNIARSPRVYIFVFADTRSLPMSDIQQAVREKYGAIASSVANASKSGGCCGPTACGCGD